MHITLCILSTKTGIAPLNPDKELLIEYFFLSAPYLDSPSVINPSAVTASIPRQTNLTL
jgi:hypothetical protein